MRDVCKDSSELTVLRLFDYAWAPIVWFSLARWRICPGTKPEVSIQVDTVRLQYDIDAILARLYMLCDFRVCMPFRATLSLFRALTANPFLFNLVINTFTLSRPLQGVLRSSFYSTTFRRYLSRLTSIDTYPMQLRVAVNKQLMMLGKLESDSSSSNDMVLDEDFGNVLSTAIEATPDGIGLLAATKEGDERGALELLHKGTDPNIHDGYGWSPLMYAAAARMRVSLLALLDAGASVNHRDVLGRTALHVAASSGNVESVNILSQLAADLDSPDIFLHQTPIMLSLISQSADDISEILLRAGSKPNVSDVYGTTPLMLAADKGIGRVVERLLSLGGDPNLMNDIGATALMYACASGNERCIKALLDSGASINQADVGGRTPKEWAEEYGQLAIVSLVSG